MQRAALLAVAFLVAGVACLLWIDGSERGGHAPVDPGATTDEEREDAAAELLAPTPSSAEPPEEKATGSPHAGRRTSKADERSRIAGRVQPDGGYPGAAEARLTAEVYSGRENAGPPSYLSTKVARDGSFELFVSKGARYAMLDVQSDLLYLQEAVKARPGEDDVVLVPDVFALIQGRVLAPLGMGPLPPQGVKISCRRDRLPEESAAAEPTMVEVLDASAGSGSILATSALEDVSSISEVYKVEAEPDGTFLLVLMPTGVRLQLEAQNPLGPAWCELIDPLLPGERREVVIALDAGITLAGIVIDEHGAPVSGVTVSACEVVGGQTWKSVASDETNEDGSFELSKLARKGWSLRTNGRGFVRHAELLVDGEAGDARELVLSVVRGGCVAGTVVWPDGRSVQSFSVRAYGEVWAHGDFQGGAFELCGVSEEPNELHVIAENDGVRGTAQLSGVRAGDRGLRIALNVHQVFEVRGTVVDSEQRPVKDFHAYSLGLMGSRSSTADGAFVLEGLPSGECSVQVTADGMRTEIQQVLVGPSTPPLRFVLVAAGRIRGLVLDPRGRPVAGAEVAAGPSGFALDAIGWNESRTDKGGRFDVPASVSPMFVRAMCDGYASSEPVEVSTSPGEILDGIVLSLRDACRLEGRVLDPDGRAVEGAWISVSGPMGDNEETDPRGLFVFDALPPGRVVVSAMLDSGSRASAIAVVAAGRTTSIELRFEPRDPVRVFGRILHGGRPIALEVGFFSSCGVATDTSDATGHFEAVFERPGEWRCTFTLAGEGSEPRIEDFRVLDFVVPDVEEFELELDLDAARPIQSFEEIGY